jgi:membrane protease YdiL (CAAX protease family)
LATVLTSGLFAVLHLQYGFGVHVVFLYGLMLSWARLRTGGLSAPIVMHMVINALATLSAMRS